MRFRKSKTAILAAAAIALIPSCASIGTPSGGPRDEDPPRFLYSNPGQGATEFNGNKAVLNFDEYINVKDAFNNVVMSPPGVTTPRVSSLGKRITVEFRDTLLPNTTYTIDFGDAIVDNNEGNVLENFLYSFSTGPTLDTLMISGMVLAAEDLEPQKGIIVGLHSNLSDTAFTKLPFERIAKTNSKGQFAIGGLAPGTYRVYALNDMDGDLKYSSPEETIAFYDVAVSPFTETITVTDSIFDLKTGMVDTIVNRVRTRFLPNNILLRSFNSGFKQQYIDKYQRPDSARITLAFNTKNEELPLVEIVAPDGTITPISEVAVIERNQTNDSLTFWLKDNLTAGTDTLRVAVNYFRADSAFNPMAVSDTLRLLKPKIKPLSKKELEKQKKKLLEETGDTIPKPVEVNFKAISSRVEKNLPLVFESEMPLARLDTAGIKLEIKADSLWIALPPPEIVADSLNPRRMSVYNNWDYDATYKLTVDSLAGQTYTGLNTAPFEFEFKIRPEKEYSALKLNISGLPADMPTFVELVDGSGTVKARGDVENSQVLFEYMLPGKYIPRIIFDRNGNGKFDPGNFDLGVQTDVSYYYPDQIELKQNWTQDQNWNIFSTPVDKMREQKKTTQRR